ncbi:unnamed protein product [Echinostoma caproni]|uniref:UDENN domain-containing protein n=1 Tax=Echinostoma caproni TaxID=27848 RepID=A0A183ATK1_9TREM|nr:unnamed protein product [Echinostoma caproni]
MLVAECITCLLLPFVWPHVYAPILPLSLAHFVDAPVPYIMGIRYSSSDTSPHPSHTVFSPELSPNEHRLDEPSTMRGSKLDEIRPHAVELASEANVCYVYIDEGRVIAADEVPQFPNSDYVKEALYQIIRIASSLTSGK